MNWLLNNWDQVLEALGQHIVIALTSIGIAFAISLVVGIWAARREAVFHAAIAVSSILYTIPTLAFLALLIPIVGLGKANAIICMVAFSLMIMIRNVAVGIRNVPSEVVDAGRGMGMTAFDILTRIELPLAAPVIVAGLRIAIGTRFAASVTSSPLNPRYAQPSEMRTYDSCGKIGAGALTACALAIAADLSLARLEAWLRGRAA
jgi:osmoprotectant transport system permease protein